MRDQQARFDAFKREYNEQRPHEALKHSTPGDFYKASHRSFPQRLPEPAYPDWFEVVTADSGGFIGLRGSRYFISSAVSRERVGLAEIEEGCWEVYFCKKLLGRIHTAHPDLGLVMAA